MDLFKYYLTCDSPAKGITLSKPCPLFLLCQILAKLPPMTFASEFFENVDNVTTTLLEMSTSKLDDNTALTSAKRKEEALQAIEYVQSKYKQFLNYSNFVIYTLAAFASGTGDEYKTSDAFDKVFAAADAMAEIGGKASPFLDLVSRSVPTYNIVNKPTHCPTL